MVDSMIESDTKKTLASPKAPKNNSLIQFLAKIQKINPLAISYVCAFCACYLPRSSNECTNLGILTKAIADY